MPSTTLVVDNDIKIKEEDTRNRKATLINSSMNFKRKSELDKIAYYEKKKKKKAENQVQDSIENIQVKKRKE